MRTILELVVAAALVAAAWEKPWHQQVGAVIPALAPAARPTAQTYHRPIAIPDTPPPAVRNAETVTAHATEPLAAPAASAPTKHSADWMFDPKRPGSLDRPGATPAPTFSNHIYYKDEQGKKYWQDAQGNRHYE